MNEWNDAVDSNGLTTREFRITGDDARDVTGSVWLPAESSKADTLMCFGHGASGNRYQAPICDLAGRFITEAGIPVLSIDGRYTDFGRWVPVDERRSGRNTLAKIASLI